MCESSHLGTLFAPIVAATTQDEPKCLILIGRKILKTKTEKRKKKGKPKPRYRHRKWIIKKWERSENRWSRSNKNSTQKAQRKT